MTNSIHAILWLSVALLFSGCGREGPVRTTQTIRREQNALPRLYITAKTSKQIVAPGAKELFVDAATGEIAWPALTCNNPNCPGRAGGEPVVFIAPDPGYFVTSAGTIEYAPANAKAEDTLGFCPECLKTRNLASEPQAARQKYINWVGPYELPETKRRREELDAELKRRNKALRDRMGRAIDE